MNSSSGKTGKMGDLGAADTCADAPCVYSYELVPWFSEAVPIGFFLGALGTYLWQVVVADAPSTEWNRGFTIVTMGLALAAWLIYRLVPEIVSTFRLTEDQLRQERPLRADKEVFLREIRRLFIGGHSVEVYTSPGSKPDLEFERKLQGGDELIEKLARRLPPGAEIEHPSGELAGRLAGQM
jgi:hypothetical protein